MTEIPAVLENLIIVIIIASCYINEILFVLGSRRRAARVRDTPESSPERSQKAKLAAKVRDDARKKMLAQKRAAMKQRQQEADEDVEIYVGDNGSKSDSPGRTSGSDGADA